MSTEFLKDPCIVWEYFSQGGWECSPATGPKVTMYGLSLGETDDEEACVAQHLAFECCRWVCLYSFSVPLKIIHVFFSISKQHVNEMDGFVSGFLCWQWMDSVAQSSAIERSIQQQIWFRQTSAGSVDWKGTYCSRRWRKNTQLRENSYYHHSISFRSFCMFVHVFVILVHKYK